MQEVEDKDMKNISSKSLVESSKSDSSKASSQRKRPRVTVSDGDKSLNDSQEETVVKKVKKLPHLL